MSVTQQGPNGLLPTLNQGGSGEMEVEGCTT